MIPIVSFIGRSNSGKTTLLEKVVRGLKSRGYRVGVVKHSPHGFELDQPGKDSWRLVQAGGDIVGLSSPRQTALIARVESEPGLAHLSHCFEGKIDILLGEGFKNSPVPKIVVRGREESEPLRYRGEVLAIVTPRWSPSGVPQYDEGEVGYITGLLTERISRSSSASEMERLLDQSAAVHGHICPGQVLGVRMALKGCRELGIRPKEEKKRLMVYVEIDSCAVDAIQAVTGCTLGKRTMKYVDYGKLAATFVDLPAGRAVRLAVREEVRRKAVLYLSPEGTKQEAEVAAYRALADEELFSIEPVVVESRMEDLPGPPLSRVICERCGEGINDYREVRRAGMVLCRACASGAYYRHAVRLDKECLASPEPSEV